MSVARLPADEVAALDAAPLTYARGGAEDEDLKGFSALRHTRVLRRRDLEGAAADLFAWRMHARAGLRVRAADIPLGRGTVVVLRWGPGPLSLRVPCRVVDVVDEPRRRGFSYGTLPGHPESGEEQFLLEQLDDGRLRLTIAARSQPASTLARLGGPAARALQRLMVRRYLHALDRL